MTEEEARNWVVERFPDRISRLEAFVDLVVGENARQNLIAPASVPLIWSRHIADSAQLLALGAETPAVWTDVGTGAGFPGMVVAALDGAEHTLMIEPRRKRAVFLRDAADYIGVGGRVTIIQSRVEVAHAQKATVVSARAVAPAYEIFAATQHLADYDTRYVLPRGRSAFDEIESLTLQWHGVFHVERSITDPDSGILIADKVCKR